MHADIEQIRVHRIIFVTLALLFLLPLVTWANNRVVVIPLNSASRSPTPFAPLAASSPAYSDYTIRPATVIDNKTGLEWQKQTSAAMDWDTAVGYCSDLGTDSKTDWRLPEVLELQSIVDYGKTFPAINIAAFPGTTSSGYWSASNNATFSTAAWVVNFDIGRIGGYLKTDPYSVRCVRLEY